MNNIMVTVLGPTAVGKTRLGAMLANKYNGEIISADSRQVYKGMDIGTGKDLKDYSVEGEKINYHMIDIINPSMEFNLYSFLQNFIPFYSDIIKRNKTPFLVGGTGLYLDSILRKYKLKEITNFSEKKEKLNNLDIEELKEQLLRLKPEQHNTTDLIEKERIIDAILVAENDGPELQLPEIDNLVIGIKMDRETIKKNITARLKQRLAEGMIEEVKTLMDNGISFERLDLMGLEYRYIAMYLCDKINYNDMFQKLNSSIHKFAKRQMTWFRKMEKEGVNINWIKGPDFDSAVSIIENKIC